MLRPLRTLPDLYCKWYDFLNNDDQKQCQERVQAATEQNHQKATLNINQKIKKKRLKKKKQFADDQEQINSKQKRKTKDFGITYEIRKRIKDVKIKKEIDFEHLESEILEIEKNVVTNKELKFAFAQPTN